MKQFFFPGPLGVGERRFRKARHPNHRCVAQVGIMLNGCVIDNMVIGGPAYNCARLERGDLIFEVDLTPVTGENVHEMLLGSDVPGTQFAMKVKKATGQVKEVQISRMATEVIADRRRMFELFTKMKVSSPFYRPPSTRILTAAIPDSFNSGPCKRGRRSSHGRNSRRLHPAVDCDDDR